METRLFTAKIMAKMLGSRLSIDDKEENVIKDVILNPFGAGMGEVAIRFEDDNGVFIKFNDLFNLITYGLCESKVGVLRMIWKG